MNCSLPCPWKLTVARSRAHKAPTTTPPSWRGNQFAKWRFLEISQSPQHSALTILTLFGLLFPLQRSPISLLSPSLLLILRLLNFLTNPRKFCVNLEFGAWKIWVLDSLCKFFSCPFLLVALQWSIYELEAVLTLAPHLHLFAALLFIRLVYYIRYF